MDFKKRNRLLVILKAMANANRLKILVLINNSPDGFVTVGEVSEKLELSQPKVSDHLKLMRINKILKAKQAGARMHYSIIEPLVVKLLGSA